MRLKIIKIPLKPWTIFLLEILLPFFFVLIISQCFFNSSYVIHWLDRYRFPKWLIDTQILIEEQLLHIESLKLQPYKERIIFLGSSSVRNGIDSVSFEKRLKNTQKDEIRVLNYGLTNFMAYELLFLEDYLRLNEQDTVIYLYNTFSFADQLQPQLARTRWRTSGAIKLMLDLSRVFSFEIMSNGMLSENVFLVRYRNFLRNTLKHALYGTLQSSNYYFDYPKEEKHTLNAYATFHPPISDNHWLRLAYKDSDSNSKTLGYESLKKFLLKAKQAGTHVILAPVPEPSLSYSPWAQGISKQHIDERVKRLANAYQAFFIPRDFFNDIENVPSFFRDSVHLTAKGRAFYTQLLFDLMQDQIKE